MGKLVHRLKRNRIMVVILITLLLFAIAVVIRGGTIGYADMEQVPQSYNSSE